MLILNSIVLKYDNFQQTLTSELAQFNKEQQLLFPHHEVLKIDLHCHDHNSDVPDELLGRILNVPETWLPTESLVKNLLGNHVDALTITNHNNARSCFDLLDKGLDVLVGAEFTCLVPDFNTSIHVLSYGFSPEQETRLNKLRKNLYSFLEYTASEDIPTIWAHPLYYYKPGGSPPLLFFDKLALLFERFEVLNGQRDTWQNLLVRHWIGGMNEEKLHHLSRITGITPGQFTRNPLRKSLSGGSDSHMGIFCGLTGTRLWVPELEKRLVNEKKSSLCLEAIREGRMAPYGNPQNSERMTITFLDYFCQIALQAADPGLMRILLHKGSVNQKLMALLVSNGFAELRKHKVTMGFIQLFHASLTGQSPHFTKRWFIPKVYKPVFDDVTAIAKSYQAQSPDLAIQYQESVYNMFSNLTRVLTDRLTVKLQKLKEEHRFEKLNVAEMLEKLELPSEIRSFLSGGKSNLAFSSSEKSAPDIKGFLDGLSFPFLASSVILSAHFTSSHVLYKSRDLLNEFSASLDYLAHPKRMLWLTDTFEDANGVSTVLKSMLQYIQQHDLPVDLLVCSSSIMEEDHLCVVKPVSEFSLPFYEHQPFRIPNILDIHKLFASGEYDRIMCSTEGAMGLATLYLKQAFSVPAYFYIHTDWMTFAKKVLALDKENTDRVKRLLRAFYRLFDKLFVLNRDQQIWLTGKKMEISESAVCLTAHWADPCFYYRESVGNANSGINQPGNTLLFVGRLSKEKGVFELPAIYKNVIREFPETRLIIVGKGPAEEELKGLLPQASFLGWMDQENLASVYSSADLLILPSKFDTFSCVVIEALSCKLPVVAYATKGPKDILQDGINGFLVKNEEGFSQAVLSYLRHPEMHQKTREAAAIRAETYSAGSIMLKLMKDVGLDTSD
jgi:glycosyltransferase involved in cell wall biosynthesis